MTMNLEDGGEEGAGEKAGRTEEGGEGELEDEGRGGLA